MMAVCLDDSMALTLSRRRCRSIRLKMQLSLMKDSIHGNCMFSEACSLNCRYVLGHEAMKRMGASSVLIVGLTGLGCEIGTLSLSIRSNSS
jgi:hypothetical protein